MNPTNEDLEALADVLAQIVADGYSLEDLKPIMPALLRGVVKTRKQAAAQLALTLTPSGGRP